MSQTRRPRIGISGSYGGLNLGDEAILEGILTRLRASIDAEITVFSRNAADTSARIDVDRVVPVRSLTRKEIAPEVGELDLLILGGGGILYDGEAETYLREVFLAHDAGVPVLLYAISAGPLASETSRRAVRDALNASPTTIVTVRDRLAYRLLEDVGVVRDIQLVADPAFLLEPAELAAGALEAEGVHRGRELVGFSVREPGPAAPDIDPDEYHALLANTADFMVDRYNADVVFVPMERADLRHSHAVVAHMQNADRVEVLRRRYSPRQILALMDRFDFVVGMRLHFLIFATLRGTPFAALPYATKVTGLLEELEIERPPLGNISAGGLIAEVDRSWDNRDRIRTTIASHLPPVEQRAKVPNELVLARLRALGFAVPASG
ncbi:MAG: polysaccharide pyruvyl transferase family protein [Gaiellaceae bacterium]